LNEVNVELFPELRLGLTSGWLPLAAFFIIYAVLLLTFSQHVRQRLYDRADWTRQQRTISAISGPFALVGIVLITLTPLKLGQPIFLVGTLIYLGGFLAFVRSLFDFKNAPAGKPATDGLYRWSRNPQWVAFALVVLSTGLMVGSFAAIGFLSVRIALNHARILGEERACIQAYGDAYLDYMQKVPRYILGL
jgi:protein-S-isoprenylcysteine O-methyltransferase Ste14